MHSDYFENIYLYISVVFDAGTDQRQHTRNLIPLVSKHSLSSSVRVFKYRVTKTKRALGRKRGDANAEGSRFTG